MNDLAIALFASASAFLFFAWLTMSLRMYVRIIMIKAVGVDDYLMIAALLFYTLSESFAFDGIRITQGKSLLELLEVLTPGYRDMYFGEVFYVLSVWTLKLSIGAFLLRLVRDKNLRYVIFATLAVVSVYSTVYLCLVIFQCTPVSHFWHPLGKGKCIPGHINTITSYVHAIVIGGSDLIFATLPIALVWNLQMNLAMKISVAGLLGLGAIGGITSLIRIAYIKALGEATPFDFFAVTSRLAIWTCLEPGVGLFVGNVAALRPLFRKLLGGSGLFGSHSSRTHITTNNHYWPSSRTDNNNQNQTPYHLENFSGQNKRGGFTSTVVQGSVKKNGKKWSQSTDTVEALNRKESKEGIQKTVEFESVTSQSGSSATHTPSQTPTKEEPFAKRGGFC